MKKIVILGGGFAGVVTALQLRHHNNKAEIILISKDDCFVFVPSLYETAAGELSEGDACLLISRLLSHNGITYYHDDVMSLNIDKKAIKTRHLQCIDFDIAVVAIGAESNYYDIQGAEKYTHNLKTKEDSQCIYEYVNNIILSKKPHRFIICGGGLTGVEFTGMLHEHILESCRRLKSSPSLYKIAIIESSPSILPNLPKSAIDFATGYLKKHGITIHTNSKIIRISKGYISTAEKKIAFDMAVWTGGLKTHHFITDSRLPHSDKASGRGIAGGGMLVNEHLQSINSKIVFGAGDCICPAKQEIHVIKTAQNAVEEAMIVAYNINAILNKKPLKDYIPKANKFYCSLGKKMGIYVSNTKIYTGEHIKRKKDRLEFNYINYLRKGKLPAGIY